MLVENISNDQYKITVTGEADATRLMLTLTVMSLDHSEGLVDGPAVELLPCDVDGIAEVITRSIAGPSGMTPSGTWRGDQVVLTVTKLDDALVQFKARSAGSSRTLDTTKTIANVNRMLADLEQVRDAVDRRLDNGVAFIESGGSDTCRLRVVR